MTARGATVLRLPQEGPTIMGLWESWMTDLRARNKAATTIQNYTEALVQFGAFLASRGNPREVIAVTRDEVRAFINHLLGEKRVSSTTGPDAVRDPARVLQLGDQGGRDRRLPDGVDGTASTAGSAT